MLGKLFGSNARVKILKLFLMHPDQKYYIRQLSRDLKLQVNSVRRELENLEQFGLLVSKVSTGEEEEEVAEEDSYIEILNYKDKKSIDSIKSKSKKTSAISSAQSKKYYQANKDFVLFEEIKALIAKAQILYEKDFIKKLEKLGKVKLLILSGIFVNSDSPVDILAVGRVPKEGFAKLIKELERELGKEINYTLMETKEFLNRRDITDIFLYEILEGKKIIVIDELIVGK